MPDYRTPSTAGFGVVFRVAFVGAIRCSSRIVAPAFQRPRERGTSSSSRRVRDNASCSSTGPRNTRASALESNPEDDPPRYSQPSGFPSRESSSNLRDARSPPGIPARGWLGTVVLTRERYLRSQGGKKPPQLDAYDANERKKKKKTKRKHTHTRFPKMMPERGSRPSFSRSPTSCWTQPRTILRPRAA